MSLVERLRARKIQRPIPGTIFYVEEDHPLNVEAADRIEALEAELSKAREAALEEAAKVADTYECSLMDYGGSVDAKNFYEGGMLDAGQGIAAAIRSLRKKEG